LQQVGENLRTQAVILREIVRDRQRSGDHSAESLRRAIRESNLFSFAALVDEDGDVLLDTERTPEECAGANYALFREIDRARGGMMGTDRRANDYGQREMMYLALPIPPSTPLGGGPRPAGADQPRVAVVRVGLPLGPVREQVRGLRWIVWTTAAGTAGLAMLLTFWLARRSAKPLQALTRGAEQIAAGKFGHQVQVVSQDEIGRLAHTFNRMSRHLAEQFTQLEDDREKLRRLERLRQEFVANVSHELKTPLAVITACVETLLDGAADDAPARAAFLAQVAEQADHLHALILDLLSLARVESGAEVFDFQDVALAEAVPACLERHRAHADSKRHLLETIVPAEGHALSVMAWADEEAVGQILDNLVDNAVKYTPEGGRIQVRWWAEDGQACLEVADSGIGIPEADLPRVFERFYRVDKARSRELGGTGLGLAIVKHLAQAMRGSVAARSRPGQGSTFTVRLPAVRSRSTQHSALSTQH
jgi:signal transduction histidine kinase